MIASRAPRRVAVMVALGTTFALGAMAPTSTASAAESQPKPAANAVMPAPERAAATAIADITAPGATADPLAGIPSDFVKVMGYQPTLGKLANGKVVAINPHGGCSVIGGGRPFDLAIVCKAHDLGYDLLRYAHRHGDPLGANARVRVDDTFGRDLRAQCGAKYSGAEIGACDAMGASFDAGVGFNSWRQGYGPPVATSGRPRTVAVTAFGLLMVYFAGRWLITAMIRRWAPRRRNTLRPALDLPADD